MLSNGLSPLVAQKWCLCLHMGIIMEQIVRFTCRLLPTLPCVKQVHMTTDILGSLISLT